jgi:hypothetical protein
MFVVSYGWSDGYGSNYSLFFPSAVDPLLDRQDFLFFDSSRQRSHSIFYTLLELDPARNILPSIRYHLTSLSLSSISKFHRE